MLGEYFLSEVRCLQCRARNSRCDRFKPSCSTCVKKNTLCWYPTRAKKDVNGLHGGVRVGIKPFRAERKSTFSNQEAKEGKNTDSTLEVAPMIRELCFVGQRFGTLELFLLKSYQSEYSPVMRSTVSKQDMSVCGTSLTPLEAASHATAWAAICFGAAIQKHAAAESFLGNAIQAARLCYDVPCAESLNALIAVSHAAYFIRRVDVVTSFAGCIDIMREEVEADALTDLKILYLSGLIYLTTSGQQPIRLHDRVRPRACTPAQDLSVALFDSALRAISMLQQPILSVEQERLVDENVRDVEHSMAFVMQNRCPGDHIEIHIAIILLFFFYVKTGQTNKLIPLAKEMIDLYCSHPLMLHTSKWHNFAVGFSRFLCRCGEIEVANRMWKYLRIYHPLNAVRLGPLHIEIEIDSRGGKCPRNSFVTSEAIAEFYRILC